MPKPAPFATSETFQKVISGMQNDNISLVIKNDKLLCTFGERYKLKQSHDANRYGYVRGKLRELAQLHLEMCKLFI